MYLDGSRLAGNLTFLGFGVIMIYDLLNNLRNGTSKINELKGIKP